MIDSSLSAALDDWQQLPDWSKITVARLRQDPELRQSVSRLVYRLVQAADKQCGPATDENALLSRIAANPGAVEAE